MSRLIVKNLPKNVTSHKLQELFSQKGLVTDVQLKYTKDGTFRRFAFVGFKTDEEAIAAKTYFDKSCIDTCKISVEQCASLGDSAKPRSWSKYALDSSQSTLGSKNDASKEGDPDETAREEAAAKNKKEKKKKKKEKLAEDDKVKKAMEKHKDDPLFAEFLESHTATGMKTTWGNDAPVTSAKVDEDNDHDDKEDREISDVENEEREEKKIANKVISDLEYMERLKMKEQDKSEKDTADDSKPKHGELKLFTVKLRGLGYNHKKKDIKQFFKPLKAKSIRVPPKIRGIAYVGFKTEQQLRKALLKNKSFLGGKQLFLMRYEAKDEAKDDLKNQENKTNVKWKKQEEALKDQETIAESGRMFIRNLSYTTTEEDVRQLFEKYGPLTEVNLPIDKITRKPKGFGTVTFMMTEHAVKAYSELDGTVLNGRMLHVLPGKAKSDPAEELADARLSYKEKKELKTKSTAGSSHNWNTLFLGQNAVAEAIAATYNTTKEKVLEDGSKGLSAAVKLALGETQLVLDTRNFLMENDVCLDAFNQPANKRSKTVILVKNLPAATPAHEIRQMFARYGELGRVVMPPSGITALIEFLEPSEARKAFAKLAYTKYKHLPLYLEWAPDNSFTTPPTERKERAAEKTETGPSEITKINKLNVVEAADDKSVSSSKKEEDDEEPEPDTTLFVKNINFATTEEQLRTHFGKCGKLHYVTIATKNGPGGKLSMGYGFVRYKRKSDAERALKVLQMTVLDDKTLELKRSERTLTTDVQTAKKNQSKITEQTGTKLLIRNVPFQANVQEITELFKAFGELKAVRLPKKLVGVEKHRGFGFVEYYTKSEAKKAFKALCQSTHLYGRRLVLEWAQTEEGIEDIRKRTAKHFYQEESSKRSKKSTLNPEEVGLATD